MSSSDRVFIFRFHLRAADGAVSDTRRCSRWHLHVVVPGPDVAEVPERAVLVPPRADVLPHPEDGPFLTSRGFSCLGWVALHGLLGRTRALKVVKVDNLWNKSMWGSRPAAVTRISEHVANVDVVFENSLHGPLLEVKYYFQVVISVHLFPQSFHFRGTTTVTREEITFSTSLALLLWK